MTNSPQETYAILHGDAAILRQNLSPKSGRWTNRYLNTDAPNISPVPYEKYQLRNQKYKRVFDDHVESNIRAQLRISLSQVEILKSTFSNALFETLLTDSQNRSFKNARGLFDIMVGNSNIAPETLAKMFPETQEAFAEGTFRPRIILENRILSVGMELLFCGHTFAIVEYMGVKSALPPERFGRVRKGKATVSPKEASDLFEEYDAIQFVTVKQLFEGCSGDLFLPSSDRQKTKRTAAIATTYVGQTIMDEPFVAEGIRWVKEGKYNSGISAARALVEKYGFNQGNENGTISGSSETAAINRLSRRINEAIRYIWKNLSRPQ